MRTIRHFTAALFLTCATGAWAQSTQIDLTTYQPGKNDGSNFVSGSIQTGYQQSATPETLTVTSGPDLPTGTESTHNDFGPFPAGDFTAQVTVTANAFSSPGFYADFATGFAGAQYSNGIARALYGFGDQTIVSGSTQAFTPVVFRLSRAGDVFTAAFADAQSGGFQQLVQLTGSNVTGPVGMDLAVFGSTGQADQGIATYSLFTVLTQAPQDLTLAGGGASDPTLLPSGTTSVSDSIGGGAGSTDYYSFNWQGGQFSALADILHATDPDFYDLELCAGGVCTTADKLSDVTLNSGDNWQGGIADDLAPGLYTVGLSENGAGPDPDFNIIFATPVAGAVPEPSTWALMLLGFGAIGAAMRRNRKTGRLPQLA